MNRRRTPALLPFLATAMLVASVVGVFMFRLSQVGADRETRGRAVPEVGAGDPEAARVVTMVPDRSQDVTVAFTGASCPTGPIEALGALDQFTLACHPTAIPSFAPFLNHEDSWVRRAAVQSLMVLGDPQGSRLLRQAAGRAGSGSEARFMREAAAYLESPSSNPQVNERVPEELLPRADEIETPTRLFPSP